MRKRKPYVRVSYASEGELAQHSVQNRNVQPRDTLNRALEALQETMVDDGINNVEKGDELEMEGCTNAANKAAEKKRASSTHSLLHAHEEAMSYSIQSPVGQGKSLQFLADDDDGLNGNPDAKHLHRHDGNRRSDGGTKASRKRYSMASYNDLKTTKVLLKDNDHHKQNSSFRQTKSSEKIWHNDIPTSVIKDGRKSAPVHRSTSTLTPTPIADFVVPNFNALDSNNELDKIFNDLAYSFQRNEIKSTSQLDDMPIVTDTDTSNLWTGSKSFDNIDLGSQPTTGDKTNPNNGIKTHNVETQLQDNKKMTQHARLTDGKVKDKLETTR